MTNVRKTTSVIAGPLFQSSVRAVFANPSACPPITGRCVAMSRRTIGKPTWRRKPRGRRNGRSGAPAHGVLARAVPCHACRMPPAPVELPYTEIVPPVDLAPYVDRLWLRTTLRAPERVHRVLPDGCVDVIVDAGRTAAELVGPMTRAIEITGDPAEQVAVRFKPGTAAALTGCGLAELADASVDLVTLGLAGALADRVAGASPDAGAPRLPARIPLSATSHARMSALV